jgi:DUF1009 family protein
MADSEIVGLIAGEGRLPFLVAGGARKAGLKVVCVGLSGSASQALAQEVDTYYEVPLARPGAWIRKLRRHGVSRTVMVGRVRKSKIYTPLRIVRYLPDWRALRIWYWRLRKKDKRNDNVLCALADELASAEITLENSIMYCAEHIAGKGVLTKRHPSELVSKDITFGWPIAKQLGQLDIGQAVAVKEREVIAVEAIEGTAEMIVRAGQLCPAGGWTLIKAAKPNQDMRFDVPCVGPDTIQALADNKAKCLVVEAEKTIIIDKNATIELADRLGIAVVGY